MDFKSQALEISSFLKIYQSIFEIEVMDHYPISLENYNQEWVNDLKKLTDLELFDFLLDTYSNKITSPSFLNFLEETKKLKAILAYCPTPKKLEDWAYTDMKYKKRHEIDIIAPEIKKIFLENQIDRAIDIGGGVGHLARILAHYYQIPVTSIDLNSEFQKNGSLRLKKHRHPEGAKDVQFLNLKIDNESLKSLNKNLERRIILGLHSCGSLSSDIILGATYSKDTAIFNFGCCYHKISTPNYAFISNFFNTQIKLNLTRHALTLASRAHRSNEFSEFQKLKHVKRFRQSLHLFLFHKLLIKDLLDIGEMPIKNYYQEFSSYVISKLNEHHIHGEFKRNEIDDFFISDDVCNLNQEMFLRSLIRFKLGPLLEKIIVLDRAIFLQENNYTVNIHKYFDEHLSPRNIGIRAILNKSR